MFKKINALTLSAFLFAASAVHAQSPSVTVLVDQTALGFKIPDLSEILTFMIRIFFVISGLAALLFLLLGALAWVTSGGSKESVEKAQQKIQAAIIGVLMIAIVLAVIVTLEKVVFGGKVCFGISCPITIPTLVK